MSVNPLSPQSLPEQAPALIFAPNVSTVNGSVHRHRAIVYLSPYIPMVDRGALPRQALSDARTCLLCGVCMFCVGCLVGFLVSFYLASTL